MGFLVHIRGIFLHQKESFWRYWIKGFKYIWLMNTLEHKYAAKEDSGSVQKWVNCMESSSWFFGMKNNQITTSNFYTMQYKLHCLKTLINKKHWYFKNALAYAYVYIYMKFHNLEQLLWYIHRIRKLLCFKFFCRLNSLTIATLRH